MNKKTLTTQAVEQLRQMITEKKLKPGDSLPTEIELCEIFGVSRTVIREALGRLRMLGVCTSKRCRGIILQEPDLMSGFEAIIDLPLLSSSSRKSLYQLRIILELGIAPFVFSHCSQEDLDYLESLVEKEEAKPSDRQVAIEVDSAFHQRLYEISGNPLVERFQGLLLPFMDNYKYLFRADRFESEEVTSHRDLLRELKHGTQESYTLIMHQHLKLYVK